MYIYIYILLIIIGLIVPLLADLKLSNILSDQVLYSWGVDKDIVRKVIVLSSCFPQYVDSHLQKSLMVSLSLRHIFNISIFPLIFVALNLSIIIIIIIIIIILAFPFLGCGRQVCFCWISVIWAKIRPSHWYSPKCQQFPQIHLRSR